MISGLYTTAAGMTSLLRKNEVTANNLANVNTTGFKKQEAFSRAYLDYVKNDEGQPFINDAIKTDEVWTNFDQGALIKTGNTFDLALEGKGFFSLETPGGLRYSRNGSFALNNRAELVDRQGNYVLGLQGKIKFDTKQADTITISPDGMVTQAGEIIDQVRIVNFQEPIKLAPVGDALFKPAEDTKIDPKITAGSLQQGYLEASNVNTVESMVAMIACMRNYEADQKAIQSIDQTLDRAVNQIGRL